MLTFHLKQNHGGWNSDDLMTNNLGRFRLSRDRRPRTPVADPLPKRVREILAVPRDQRTPAQDAAVFSYWRTTVPEWKEANDADRGALEAVPDGDDDAGPRRPATSRGRPASSSAATSSSPASRSTPGVPAFLHPLPADAPPTRLTFAQWLVDRRSPTTARAFVNRVWQAYFGTGLVATPRGLRHAGRGAEPSRAARLAGRASSWTAAGASRRCTG